MQARTSCVMKTCSMGMEPTTFVSAVHSSTTGTPTRVHNMEAHLHLKLSSRVTRTLDLALGGLR
jgi:hypothetical protein